MSSNIGSIPAVDSIIAAFPHPPFVIEGRPSPLDIQHILDSVYGNSTTIISSLGGGQHGHLGLVLSPEDYVQHSNTPFLRPANPGAQAVWAPDATGPQIAGAERQYNTTLRIFMTTENVNIALKNFIFACIHPLYYSALKQPIVGYSRLSVFDIIVHLKTNYGHIDPRHLIANGMELTKPWDHTTPFEMLIDRFEQAIAIAKLGAQPFTDTHVVNCASTLVYQSSLYFEPLKRWHRRAAAEKTWDVFKSYMLTAQNELNDEQMATTGRLGYANLAELAQTVHANQEHFSNLADANSQLTSKLQEAMATIEKLKQLQSNPVLFGSETKHKSTPKLRLYKSYCWTHGFKVSKNHNSENCLRPADGHKKEATMFDTMGGNREDFNAKALPDKPHS